MACQRIAHWSLVVPWTFALCVSACSSSDPTAGAGSANAGSSGSVEASAGNTSSAGANAGGTSAVGDTEGAAVSGITAAHNAARAAVVPAASPAIPPLVWSASVAATAQAWADGCDFKHSGGKFGENIYATAGKDATPQEVINSWAGEAKDYDYAANTCKSTCGHYTQVVWRKSARLGCGVTKCSKNSPFPGFAEWQFWVCNYDPPGNFNNEKPY